MAKVLWSDRLQMPYASIVEYRRAGGISDDVWSDLLNDAEFVRFISDKETNPTPDESNGGNPDNFSPALKGYYERYTSQTVQPEKE